MEARGKVNIVIFSGQYYHQQLPSAISMIMIRSEAATAALVLSGSPSRGARRLLRHSSPPLYKPGNSGNNCLSTTYMEIQRKFMGYISMEISSADGLVPDWIWLCE